jgi:hypothetical protein
VPVPAATTSRSIVITCARPCSETTGAAPCAVQRFAHRSTRYGGGRRRVADRGVRGRHLDRRHRDALADRDVPIVEPDQ